MKPKLALFFTRGVSLKLWKEVGMFDREVKPYRKLLNYFDDIYFLSYGQNERCENFKVLPVSGFRKELRNVDILKTNQLSGSWNAVIAKKIFKKKLVVRQGKQWSIFAREKKLNKLRIIMIDFIEWLAYKNADAIIASSFEDKKYIEKRYKIHPEKVNYIPNYIDTDLFSPNVLIPVKHNRILTVAKLEKQKNLENLIEAVRGLDIKLTIVGQGSLEKELKKVAPVNVEFITRVSNNDLPKEINKSQLFILPSNFEGCPKALLEAMSCGVPVIGADVVGINNIIKDKENGYLCKTSTESIRKKIKEVLAEKNPVSGRETIIKEFSLKELVNKEVEIYDKILAS